MKTINKPETAIEFTSVADFKKYKSQIDRIYGDDRTLIRSAGGRKVYSDVAKIGSRDELVKTFTTNLGDPTKAADYSETLVALGGPYAEIIDYFVNIPLYRYTVVPTQVKKGNKRSESAEKYAEVYNKMMSVVDGISLEVVLPKILQQGLIYGIIYIYLEKDNSSETVETFILPTKYCRKGFTTNFGTDTVIFDFKFFTDLKTQLRSNNGLAIEDDMFYDLFPAAMVKQYEMYVRDISLRFQELDPKFSSAISFSPSGVPPKLASNFGIIDYNLIKSNEITRSKNELEKLLVHKIPNYEGALMFDLEESFELHDSMSSALSGVKGLKLLTTFGETELIELQPERTKENKAVEQAYAGIFHSAGMNPNIFIGDSKEALAASLKKDTGYIFKQLNFIINFYNLGMNNLFNFSPYQARINLLPISIYDEESKVEMYLNNANFGVGKLEAVVATGIKQKDIVDKYDLEQFLQLDKILVPLQSAYTSTPDDQKDVEDVEEDTVETPDEETNSTDE